MRGQADHPCPVALQLGFGSFLGIIGSNLVENKRQMVSFHGYTIRPPLHLKELNISVDG